MPSPAARPAPAICMASCPASVTASIPAACTPVLRATPAILSLINSGVIYSSLSILFTTFVAAPFGIPLFTPAFINISFPKAFITPLRTAAGPAISNAPITGPAVKAAFCASLSVAPNLLASS